MHEIEGDPLGADGKASAPWLCRLGQRLGQGEHGLFADGSSWSEVIPRLQAAGLNMTSVQNPREVTHLILEAAGRRG